MHASDNTTLPHFLLKQRYRILHILGEGGMGTVYKAQDIQTQKLVAIKEMHQQGTAIQMEQAIRAFQQEVNFLAQLQHPHLPTIYEHFFEDGRWFLVMFYIEGETLEDYLYKTRQQPLAADEVIGIALQLGSVLEYLHSRKPPIIFRDLKPANIMHTPEGQCYLIDFGIARHFKQGQLTDTVAFGSTGYAPPEQYGKTQSSPRSDIYSLGVTLYQLLTMHDPVATPFQFSFPQANNDVIMASLIAILRQMLELSSEKRPPSAKVICDKLKKINVSEDRQALFIPLSLVSHIVPTIQPSSPKPGALLFLWQHLSPVNTVAWSPVDGRIASGEERGVVHILSMNEARDLSTYDAHRAAVTCLAWSPDGRRLASGDRRLTIHIWDMQTGKTLLIYRGHHRSKSEEQMITSLSWSPDGTRLASVSGYHTVLVWDASTGETLLRYAGHGKKALARAVAWSPDTQLIASLAESCHIWNPATGVTQTIHHAITQALSWAHDGRRLAFTSSSFLHKRFTLIKIYEVAEKRTTFLYTAHYAPIRSVAWSYNDRSIAVSSAEHISICDTTTGRRIYTYQEHTHPVSALDWCPYYPYIVSSSLDGIIRVWSTGL